ncbi:Apolipoprotein N-acyltransferase [Cribrihabitans marinus]|uniref:Apolipoprotein N-acyltransferase n=1 Tax=Cribrihabitans marinus TaxID=1227549 RepID=A0A1H6SEP4_9RHOB|nr:apolipoprotein N-acyltransferase [Cribrihabitans marinus]GGH23493.1 apolipoprotein N-acyltransferase [Cribrihabitans marinus]SEI66369.1 Apolipoprotein N-acyltransferase [Cribrihabitans marinus]
MTQVAAGRRLRRAPHAAFALGLAAATGLAPYFLWLVTLPALALLVPLFVTAPGRRAAGWIGWAFGLGYFGFGLVWIVEPFLVDVPRHGWMAPFALVLLAGGLALFWAVAFWAAAAPKRGPGVRVAALAVTWSLAELARAYLLTGFPWAGLAQIWVDSPTALLLAWIGPHGLALATLLVALPAGLLVARRPGAAPVAGLAVLGLAGAVMLAEAMAPDLSSTGRTVRLVQPNAPQHQKWDPEHAPVFFRRQLAFTEAAPRPDLIVWPETAIPVWLENAGPTLDRIAGAADGVPVVLGLLRTQGQRIYNSLVVLGADGRVGQTYDKHHLVPFGEYVPLGDLMARFGIAGLAASDGQGFSAGPGPRTVDLGPLGLALPLICYEAVFPQDINRAPVRPAMLLQITNDAWFGSFSGPYQHLAQARMRAIEQGLPMLRAANTGVSAMIDPLGRVTASLPLGRAGHLDAELPAPLPAPLYARTGDTPMLLLLLAMAAALALWPRRRGTANSD